MRVTQNMMANNVLNNLTNNYSKIANYQDELSSGKKVTKPSDDPVAASLGITYRSDVSRIAQYQTNVTTAQKWMDSSNDALSQVNDVLNQVYDLTLQANNSTETSDELNADATEVDQLTQQLVTIGNTQVAGQYIFSGSDSANPLLTTDSSGTVTINSTATSQPNLSLAVNDGTQMTINVNPTNIFTADLFSTLTNLKSALQNSSSTSGNTLSDTLSKLSDSLDAVSNMQSDIGAREQRVNLISTQLGDENTTATKIMANNEDADYASTVVSLNQQQNVYQASLAAGARIIQQSLVNYLQ